MPSKMRHADSTRTGVASTTLKARLEQAEREEHLRAANATLARENSKLRYRQSEMLAALGTMIDTAAQGLVIPRVAKPLIKSGRRHAEEKAIICVGDLQLAKTTPTYNTDVCERRMGRYAEIAAKLTMIQRSDHPVNDARVYLLGDILEGELIFPHQAHQLDRSLYSQLMIDAPRIIVNYLRSLLTVFRHVHVVCVPGNHGALGGRAGRAYNPESNADRMLYRLVQGLLAAEPRLSWQIPYQRNEAAWYAVDYPFGGVRNGFMLFHGDQIPNPGSASTGTIARRVWGYSAGAIAEPFDNVIFGHWHTPKYIPLNKLGVWCNGSVESTNTYAQERLSAIGQPIQLMMFCHEERGVTGQYWVKLEDKPVESPQFYHSQIEPLPPVPKPALL